MQPRSVPNPKFQAGLRIFHSGQYKEAIPYFEEVLSIESHNKACVYLLLNCYSETAQLDKAEIFFQRINHAEAEKSPISLQFKYFKAMSRYYLAKNNVENNKETLGKFNDYHNRSLRCSRNPLDQELAKTRENLKEIVDLLSENQYEDAMRKIDEGLLQKTSFLIRRKLQVIKLSATIQKTKIDEQNHIKFAQLVLDEMNNSADNHIPDYLIIKLSLVLFDILRKVPNVRVDYKTLTAERDLCLLATLCQDCGDYGTDPEFVYLRWIKLYPNSNKARISFGVSLHKASDTTPAYLASLKHFKHVIHYKETQIGHSKPPSIDEQFDACVGIVYAYAQLHKKAYKKSNGQIAENYLLEARKYIAKARTLIPKSERTQSLDSIETKLNTRIKKAPNRGQVQTFTDAKAKKYSEIHKNAPNRLNNKITPGQVVNVGKMQDSNSIDTIIHSSSHKINAGLKKAKGHSSASSNKKSATPLKELTRFELAELRAKESALQYEQEIIARRAKKIAVVDSEVVVRANVNDINLSNTVDQSLDVDIARNASEENASNNEIETFKTNHSDSADQTITPSKSVSIPSQQQRKICSSSFFAQTLMAAGVGLLAVGIEYFRPKNS